MKASEMMAERKAAKKEQAVKKYARDNIGNQRADRNKQLQPISQRLSTSGNHIKRQS